MPTDRLLATAAGDQAHGLEELVNKDCVSETALPGTLFPESIRLDRHQIQECFFGLPACGGLCIYS
jgi:hypothetical protein